MAFLMERLRPAAAGRVTSGIDVPALRGGLLGGAVAAGFGLASVAVPILLLWIVTPYVVQGPGGVVHLAACVWLLAHGAGLVRPATFGSPGYGGAGVPLAVTPLLVSVLVLAPLYRAGVRAGTPAAEDDEDSDAESLDDHDDHDGFDGFDGSEDSGAVPEPDPARVRSALLGLGVGYLLVTALVVAFAATGAISVAGPLGAFGWTALVALPVAALGVRRGAGPGGWGTVPRPLPRPRFLPGPGFLTRPGFMSRPGFLTRPLSWWPELPAWVPGRLRVPLPSWLLHPSEDGLSQEGRSAVARPGWRRAPGGASVAVRGALGGGAALLGAGGIVLAAALVAHLGAAGTVAAQTAPDLAGRLALLLLCVVVLPNAVVWSASYALGSGFVLGGSLTPLGGGAGAFTAANAPTFPLFAALPGPDRTLLGLLTSVLVLAAGPVVAVIVGRAAAEAAPRPGTDGDDPDDPDGPDFGREPGREQAPEQAPEPGWGPVATAGVALAAALGTALLAALCAAASGGALGTDALARVGPSPWRTGLAALAWTAALGVPGAVLLRWRLGLRCRRSAASATPEAWD